MSAHDTHEHTARNCLWCKDIVDILEIEVLRCWLTNNLNYKTYWGIGPARHANTPSKCQASQSVVLLWFTHKIDKKYSTNQCSQGNCVQESPGLCRFRYENDDQLIVSFGFESVIIVWSVSKLDENSLLRLATLQLPSMWPPSATPPPCRLQTPQTIIANICRPGPAQRWLGRAGQQQPTSTLSNSHAMFCSQPASVYLQIYSTVVEINI